MTRPGFPSLLFVKVVLARIVHHEHRLSIKIIKQSFEEFMQIKVAIISQNRGLDGYNILRDLHNSCLCIFTLCFICVFY